MGWDAMTYLKKDYENNKLKSPYYDRLFAEAHKKVEEKLKGTNQKPDRDLRTGGLDCSDCERMLTKAVLKSANEYCYDEKGWSADKVRLINSKANWNFRPTKEDKWAYWSARMFLLTCATAGIRIYFSY